MPNSDSILPIYKVVEQDDDTILLVPEGGLTKKQFIMTQLCAGHPGLFARSEEAFRGAIELVNKILAL